MTAQYADFYILQINQIFSNQHYYQALYLIRIHLSYHDKDTIDSIYHFMDFYILVKN